MQSEPSRALIYGDLILDQYIFGSTGRISPEAPVPVVKKELVEYRLGGAANVARNLASLNVTTTVLVPSSYNESRSKLLQLLKNASIQTLNLDTTSIDLSVKCRVISQAQQILRIDSEPLCAKHDTLLHSKQVHSLLPNYDMLIISDYMKGVVGDCRDLICKAKELDVKVLVDSKNRNLNLFERSWLIKINLNEFESSFGRSPNMQDLTSRAIEVKKSLLLDNLVVTLGPKGMLLVDSDNATKLLPSYAKSVYDVTGAGDTVLATIAACSDWGLPLEAACDIASYSASIVISRLGTDTITFEDLQPLRNKNIPRDPIANSDYSIETIAKEKLAGKSIVFTNGCFDILHPGHLYYLQEAKRLGDLLVVGLNSDESVRRLKGSKRPINNLSHRTCMLNSLSCVDFIIPFPEDTPFQLIQKIQPNVIVKGGDYTAGQIIGAQYVESYGGSAVIIPFLDGYSTTQIVNYAANAT